MDENQPLYYKESRRENNVYPAVVNLGKYAMLPSKSDFQIRMLHVYSHTERDMFTSGHRRRTWRCTLHKHSFTFGPDW